MAASYLQEAAAGGFPKQRAAYATMLYGKTLYRAGKSSLAVRRCAALPLNPEQAAEIHHLLASSYLLDADAEARRSLGGEFGRVGPIRPVAGAEDPLGCSSGRKSSSPWAGSPVRRDPATCFHRICSKAPRPCCCGARP